MALHVELVSPEEIVYQGDADLVIARTSDGEIGFQQGHVPFVGNLVSSVVRIGLSDGGVQHIAVHSGFIQLAHDNVSLLCDIAELAAAVDVERAQAALDRAGDALRSDSDDLKARAAEQRAQARLLAARGAS